MDPLTTDELTQTLLRYDPLRFATQLLGFQPNAAQRLLLHPGVQKAILCCHRGAGKTEIIAHLAGHHVYTVPNATVLVCSETAEKAAELIQRTIKILAKLGFHARPDKLRKNGFVFPNGSRLLPMPTRAGAVRGYAATMVIIDEAATVPDKVYTAIRGTRAATSKNASFWIMSTPGARSGFFYDLWNSPDPTWTRIHLSALDNPRISAEFLAEEKRQMHPDDFAREYLAEFGDTRTALFRQADIRAAVQTAVPILGETSNIRPIAMPVLLNDGTTLPNGGFLIAVDLGQARDHTALAVVEYALVPRHRRDPVYFTWLHDMKLRLRWLAEFPLDASYADLAPILNRLLAHPEVEGRAQILLDATGNRPFYDQLRAHHRKLPIKGIQITAGAQVSQSGDLLNMPKQDLVLTLESLLRQGHLQIAADCPEVDKLVKQLHAFERIRLPSGRYAYTGKSSGCDDLVMALAMAVGYAYHRHRALFTGSLAT